MVGNIDGNKIHGHGELMNRFSDFLKDYKKITDKQKKELIKLLKTETDYRGNTEDKANIKKEKVILKEKDSFDDGSSIDKYPSFYDMDEIIKKLGPIAKKINLDQVKQDYLSYIKQEYKHIYDVKNKIKEDSKEGKFDKNFVINETSFKKNPESFKYFVDNYKFNSVSYENVTSVQECIGIKKENILKDQSIKEIIEKGKNENLENVLYLMKKSKLKPNKMVSLLKNENIKNVIINGNVEYLFCLMMFESLSEENILNKIANNTSYANLIIAGNKDVLSVYMKDIAEKTDPKNIFKVFQQKYYKFSEWYYDFVERRKKWKYGFAAFGSIASIYLSNLLNDMQKAAINYVTTVFENNETMIDTALNTGGEAIEKSGEVIKTSTELADKILYMQKDINTSDGVLDWISDRGKEGMLELMEMAGVSKDKLFELSGDIVDLKKTLGEGGVTDKLKELNIQNAEIKRMMEIMGNNMDKVFDVINIMGWIGLFLTLLMWTGYRRRGKVNNTTYYGFLIGGMVSLITIMILLKMSGAEEYAEQLMKNFFGYDGK